MRAAKGIGITWAIGGCWAVGLNEFMPIQPLLDTCATAEEAREALLLNKHYFMCVPVHLLIADRKGDSFVWEYGSVHNTKYIVEGRHQPQIVTTFLLHQCPRSDAVSGTVPVGVDLCLSSLAVGPSGLPVTHFRKGQGDLGQAQREFQTGVGLYE